MTGDGVKDALYRPERSCNFRLRAMHLGCFVDVGDRHSTYRQADIGFGPAISNLPAMPESDKMKWQDASVPSTLGGFP